MIAKTSISEKKAHKEQKETSKQQVIQQRMEHVEQLERNAMNAFRNDQTMDSDTFKNMLFITDMMKNQIKRCGDTLNKNDLICIILSLDKKYQYTELQQFTISDLNTMIRSIIYDTSRFITKSSENHVSLHSSEETVIPENKVVVATKKEPVIPENKVVVATKKEPVIPENRIDTVIVSPSNIKKQSEKKKSYNPFQLLFRTSSK